MRHSIALSIAALLVTAGLCLSQPAQAYLLRVDFHIDAGPGPTADGYFTFDGSVVPTGGGEVWSPALASLSFLYGGVAWDAGNTGLTYLGFEADGSLRDWNVDNLGYYDPGYDGPQMDIFGFMWGAGGEFQYWDGSIPFASYGHIDSWTVTRLTPEPGVLALLGFLPLVLLRRFRRA